MRSAVMVLAFAAVHALTFSQDISLPAPRTRVGVDVIDAINARTGARTFAEREVPPADLATVLWAGCGVRRGVDATSAASKALRTIPFSGDRPYLRLYLLDEQGAFWYDPVANLLRRVAADDVRDVVTARVIAGSPFMVLFVADLASAPAFMRSSPIAVPMQHAAAAAAGENMAVVAAALGLDSLTMYGINAAEAADALRLGADLVPLSVMQFGRRR